MTLVCAIYSENAFDVYADTQVSGQAGSLCSTYSKLLVLPIKYTARGGARHAFEIGMAVSGGTIVCAAIFGLLCPLLQNMRSDETRRAPLFDEIADLAVSASRTVYKDTSPTLGKASLFSFLLCGIDQPTGKARWTVIETVECSTGWEIQRLPCPDLIELCALCLGSAKASYISYMEDNAGNWKNAPSALFNQFLTSGQRSDVGGEMAYLRVDQEGARLVPVLVNADLSGYAPRIAGIDAFPVMQAGKYKTITRARFVAREEHDKGGRIPFKEFPNERLSYLSASLSGSR